MEHVLILTNDVAGDAGKILRRLTIAAQYQKQHQAVLVVKESLVVDLIDLGVDRESVVPLSDVRSTETSSFMNLCDSRGKVYVTGRTIIHG